MTTVTYPSAVEIVTTYTYDAVNRLTNVEQEVILVRAAAAAFR